MKLYISEPSERHAGPILVCDEAHNDIAEFFHNEHATVGQSYETALAWAKKLTGDDAQSLQVTDDELFTLAAAAWETQTSHPWYTDALEAAVLAVRERFAAQAPAAPVECGDCPPSGHLDKERCASCPQRCSAEKESEPFGWYFECHIHKDEWAEGFAKEKPDLDGCIRNLTALYRDVPQAAPVIEPEKSFELTPAMVKLLKQRTWGNGRIVLSNDMAFRHGEMAMMIKMAEHGFVRSAEEDRLMPGPPRPPGWAITDKGREAIAASVTRPDRGDSR